MNSEQFVHPVRARRLHFRPHVTVTPFIFRQPVPLDLQNQGKRASWSRFGTSLARERFPLLGLIAWSSRRSKAYTTKSVPSREFCGNFLFRNAQSLTFLLGWHLLGLIFVTESAKDVFYPFDKSRAIRSSGTLRAAAGCGQLWSEAGVRPAVTSQLSFRQ